MGNSHTILNDRVSYFASENTWIEGNAIEQLEGVLRLPHIKKIVGLPDLHAGIGYPVGASFYSEEYFYPALIGGDIGCGMAFWQLDLTASKTRLDRLERRIGNIDGPLTKETLTNFVPEFLQDNPYRNSLGTIGLGNHFAEILTCDKIIASRCCQIDQP